jgi:hypothetical protein
MANFYLFAANGNGKWKFVFLVSIDPFISLARMNFFIGRGSKKNILNPKGQCCYTE